MGSLTSSNLLLAAVLISSALFAGGQLGPVEEGTIPDLQRGFYQNTCPQAEAIVKRTMMKNLLRDLDLPAGIIRLFFHDCFVRGCDASILLEKTPEGGEVEMESLANGRTLNGLEVINEAKAAIEAECPAIVSCADILAFAARDATVLAGLRTYPVAAGRRDGTTSRALDTVRLPSPGLNADQLIRAFASKGLTESDLVVLSGAHSIGGSTCQMFETRLYNFTGDAIFETQDPSLDIVFAQLLKLRCPRHPLPLPQVGKVYKVPFEWVTSRRLDTAYYTELMKGRGLLTTDQTLLEDDRTSSIVRQIVDQPRSWAYQFRKAMMKLGGVDVLLGNHGEIRRDCRFVNAE